MSWKNPDNHTNYQSWHLSWCLYFFYGFKLLSNAFYFSLNYLIGRAGLPVMNSSNFYLSGNVLNSPSVLKDTYVGYRLLSWQFFSVSTLSTSSHCPLASLFLMWNWRLAFYLTALRSATAAVGTATWLSLHCHPSGSIQFVQGSDWWTDRTPYGTPPLSPSLCFLRCH